ncbi:MAG: hypothetical protein ACI4UM_01105 [Succinivibrio sp.]
MFDFFKTHSLLAGVGLLAFVSLTGCSSVNDDLKGPISVPKNHIFTSHISEKSLAHEQNLLTNLLMVLENESHSQEDKAELFYEIGAVYDDLGLESLARFMLMNAIVNKPGSPRPYELLGIYFLKEGRISEASEAFDSAIELDTQKHSPYPYLNRAFLLYYTGRYAQALEDMMIFFDSDPYDPYRMLSLYTVQSKVIGRQQALDVLEKRFDAYQRTKLKKSWADNIIKVYLGRMSVDELFEDISKVQNDDDLFQEHLCEAYYYVGKLELEKGNDKLAYDYFKLCRSTDKYGFLEYRNAYHEIRALNKKYDMATVISVQEDSL